MLEELLHWLGVPGSIILVLSAGLTVYHGRHLLTIGALLGRWLRFGGVLVLLTAIAYSGLIPGIDLILNFRTIVSAIVEFLHLIPFSEFVRWLPV